MNANEIKIVHESVETWRASVHAATKCNPDIDPWPIHRHRAWLLDKVAELEALVKQAYDEGYEDGLSTGDNHCKSIQDADWDASLTKAALSGKVESDEIHN